MTGGQATLVLSAETAPVRIRVDAERSLEGVRIAVVEASEEEAAAHEQILALLDKASAGKTVWRAIIAGQIQG
jgi:DNA polymerase III subunit epsilon